MKRSYPISEETAVDQQRMEFLMKRCGSKPGPTHHHAPQGSAHTCNSCSNQWGETIKNKRTSNSGAPAPMTTTLSQSGDWEHTCNDCTTAVLGAPTEEEPTDVVAKNVVSSREEHHQLQLKDGSFTVNSSLVSPVPLLPPPPRPGTNYSSLSQGQGRSGEGEGEGTALSSLVDDSSCQCFAQEPSQVWSRTGSTCIPSPLCLHVVNHGSLSQGRGEEEEASLNSPGGVSHSLSSMDTGFKPRDPADAVRNCSRINWEVKKVIVETLTRQLLQTENYITVDYQFQDGQTSSSSEASMSWSLSREEAPPSDSVAVVNMQHHQQQQQHVSITTNNAQRQKEEQERTLSGPSERGSLPHSTNGAEPELKSRYCNDNDDELHVHVCRPHPRATRVEEQQQLEGEGGGGGGGGGRDEGAGPCGVSGGGGSCEGGEAGEDGCDGTPCEAMRWNLGGMCFGVYGVCECVCV